MSIDSDKTISRGAGTPNIDPDKTITFHGWNLHLVMPIQWVKIGEACCAVYCDPETGDQFVVTETVAVSVALAKSLWYQPALF